MPHRQEKIVVIDNSGVWIKRLLLVVVVALVFETCAYILTAIMIRIESNNKHSNSLLDRRELHEQNAKLQVQYETATKERNKLYDEVRKLNSGRENVLKNIDELKKEIKELNRAVSP